jgi:hypothetical protein
MMQVGKTFSEIFSAENHVEIKKPTVYLTFNILPLAFVLEQLDSGVSLYEIGEYLKSYSKTGDYRVVLKKHVERAEHIYDYFTKKHTLRRLKNEFISEYMLAIDELAENKYHIKEEHIPILVTLPRIYEQNTQLEGLFKNYTSYTENTVQPFDETVEYIKTVKIVNKTKAENHYFWKTKGNNLLRVRCKVSDVSNSAWQHLTKQKNVKFNTTWCYPSRVTGYEFVLLEPSGDLEIEST